MGFMQQTNKKLQQKKEICSQFYLQISQIIQFWKISSVYVKYMIAS